MVTPSFDLFCQKSKEGNLIPVYREILADTETPVSAFLKIATSDYAYLLESVEGGEKWGRYSFLGVDPATLIQAKGDRVEVVLAGERQGEHSGWGGSDPGQVAGLVGSLDPARGRVADPPTSPAGP